MDNFGRFNYSVAESSFDTWLDGYVQGAPGRKVSIYTEGCLLAFILDVHLLKYTDNQKNLDDLMRSLYLNYGDHGKGITKKDYQNEIEKLTGVSMQWYFDDYVHGTKAYTPLLIDCFESIGLKYDSKPAESDFAAYLGAKISEFNNETVIVALFPGGALDIAGAMIGDKVTSINEKLVANNANRWAKFFRPDEKEILVNRKGILINLYLAPSDIEYYQSYFIKQSKKLEKEQIDTFDGWRNV